METLVKSQLNDLDEIVNIDREVIGSDSRRKYIKNILRSVVQTKALVSTTIFLYSRGEE